MNLSPTQQIPVSYTVSDPNDTTLYYVRAVVRDTQSSTTLQSLNLTRVSSSPNRYVGLLNPVYDPSGLGRMIDVTITVYTDSGYTTPSQNYELVQNPHLVIQPWLPTLGTGGVGFEYDKMAQLIELVLDKKIKGSTKEIRDDFGSVIPKQISERNDDFKEYQNNLISQAISDIQDGLNGHSSKIIDSSEKSYRGFNESLGQIGQVLSRIIEDSKKTSENGKSDLESHVSELKNHLSVHGERMNQVVLSVSRIVKSLDGMVKNFKKTIDEKEFKYELSLQPTQMKLHSEKKIEEKKDFSHIEKLLK